MRVLIFQDLVVALSGVDSRGAEVPATLAAVPLDRLRWDGEKLIDAATLTAFWLDADGRKRILRGYPTWPEVTCAFDAAVIEDGGAWRLRTAADDLDAAKATAQALVDGQLATILAQTWTYGGDPYQIDDSSRANITAMGALASASLAAVSGAAAWPASFAWITAANEQVPMTAAQMFAFAQAVAAHVSSLIFYARTLKDQIEAAASSAAVAAINITAGWPE